MTFIFLVYILARAARGKFVIFINQLIISCLPVKGIKYLITSVTNADAHIFTRMRNSRRHHSSSNKIVLSRYLSIPSSIN